jgi:suppressor for copper-sensitivity B
MGIAAFPAIAATASISLLDVGAAVAEDARIESNWVETDFSRVRLVSASSSVGPDGSVRLGFHAVFDEGWHFYWRSAADTGFPPKFDWSKSVNVASVEIDWPAPTRYNLLGFDAYAYANEVVLPIRVTAADAAKPVSARTEVFFAICADICTFHEETFQVDLLPGEGTRTVHAALIERFAGLVPDRLGGGGMEIEEIVSREEGGKRVIEITSRSDQPFARPDLIVEGPLGFYFMRPKMTLEAGGHNARFTIPVSFEGDGADPGLWGSEVTLTLLDEARAIERDRVIPAR